MEMFVLFCYNELKSILRWISICMVKNGGKKNKGSFWKRLKNNAVYLLILALMAWLVMAGIFTETDDRFRDSFYQEPSNVNPSIYVIGIDEQTLNVYGNKIDSWGRGRLAEMIDLLNSDPATAPAVIGVDMCIFGDVESDPSGATKQLAESIKKAGNVILVEQAITGISISETDEGTFTVGRDIQYFDKPCKELSEAALDLGHCNMFLDNDSVARHGLGSLAKDGVNHSSLSYQLYRHYTGCEDERFNKAGSRFLIDYSGLPGDYYGSSFAGSSFVDVLDGVYPKEVFTGSIVLIGAFALGMRDNYQVPVGGQPMQGVEIHANMVSQMLEGRYKTEVPLWMGALILLVLGAVVLVILTKMNEKIGTPLALVLVLLYVFSCRAVYRMGGISLPLFAPTLSAVILIVTNILVRFAISMVDRRLMLDRFSRYLAPAVASRLSDTSIAEAFPVKEADIAVLFVDIHSFTTISEKIGSNVVPMLQGFFDTVLESAFRFEGTCDKMIGDCAMLLFGVPLDVKDYEFKAVQAALDMKKKMEEGAVKVDLGEGPVPITIGVGIDCGSVVCGEMGSGKYRVEYTAIGDTVNTASRIEGLAGINEVLISDETYQRLKGRIICEEKGRYQLKGKLHEETVYNVIGVNE